MKKHLMAISAFLSLSFFSCLQTAQGAGCEGQDQFQLCMKISRYNLWHCIDAEEKHAEPDIFFTESGCTKEYQ